MAIHPSVLAWRLPGTAEPGGLPSMGSHRVGHDKRLSSSSSTCLWGLPGGSEVKKPPAMQAPWVRSLGQEDTLEEEMAIHSSILAWKIPWTPEPGELHESQESMGWHKNQTQLSD